MASLYFAGGFLFFGLRCWGGPSIEGNLPVFFWDAWGSTTDLPQSCGTPNGCHKASPKSQLDGLYKPSPVMVGVWQGLLHYHER